MDTKYGSYTQILDYKGVPFRCHRCQSADHLLAQCDKVFLGKWRQDRCKDALREEMEPTKKEKGVSEVPGSHLFTLDPLQKVAFLPRSVQLHAVVGGRTNQEDSNPDE